MKKNMMNLAALIALAAALVLTACVPSIDPKVASEGSEDIPYENYIIVKLANTTARSMDLAEAKTVVNFYELVVVKLDGTTKQVPATGFTPATDIQTDRKPKGQGSLVVPVEVGEYYGVMLLSGWRSADGNKYVLLNSSYSHDRIDPASTTTPPTILPGPIAQGANYYYLPDNIIQVDGQGSNYPYASQPIPPANANGAYTFTFTSTTLTPATTPVKSFRDKQGSKVLPVTIDIPKQGKIMDATTKPTLEIEVQGFKALTDAYKVMNRATALPTTVGGKVLTVSGAANALPGVYADFSLMPLVLNSGFIINNTFPTAMDSTKNGGYTVTFDEIYDPTVTKATLKWTLDKGMFSTQAGDAYLKFKANYRAFSVGPADGNALKLTEWTIMNGLDNELDYPNHTGGAVFVRIDGGSGQDGTKGTYIIVDND